MAHQPRHAEAQGEYPHEAKVLLRFIAWMNHREKQWDEAEVKAKRDRDPVALAELRQTHFTRGLVWLHARACACGEGRQPA